MLDRRRQAAFCPCEVSQVSGPGTDRILVSSGHDDSVRILDATTGVELARIAVPADPDAAILSADGHTAYVMAAKGGAISIIDLTRMTETGRIALKPALEMPVLAGGLIAVNDEAANEIELADLATGKMVGSIALTGCEGPTGLAYAPEQGLALSACANGQAALVDIAKRKLVALLPICAGPDTAIWQASRRRFLVPCGKSGTLSIIALDAQGAHVQPAVTTETSARTAALDPETGRLYLPAAKFAPVQNGNRPAMLAGSFHIVVLALRSDQRAQIMTPDSNHVDTEPVAGLFSFQQFKKAEVQSFDRLRMDGT
jgi:DNA-binding beta-propeller fold protein YncE